MPPGQTVARDVLPNAWRVARRKDIWVENFAMWLNNAGEYDEELRQFAEAYRERKHELPFFIWRDASVQHFDTPTGALGSWAESHGSLRLSHCANPCASTCRVQGACRTAERLCASCRKCRVGLSCDQWDSDTSSIGDHTAGM